MPKGKVAWPAEGAGERCVPRDLMEEPRHIKGAWEARIVTLFPEAFPGTLGLSLTGKALDQGLWRWRPSTCAPLARASIATVDDTPAGGGAGMVLRADVVHRALRQAAIGTPWTGRGGRSSICRRAGKPFDQARARDWAAADGITLLCGRFEGVDQRVLDHWGIEEVSLGDFVLTGGEIAAQAMLDATVRLLPNVLGNAASTEEESFSDGFWNIRNSPARRCGKGREIPPVLMSGHHGRSPSGGGPRASGSRQERRPDLWERRKGCDSGWGPAQGRMARPGARFALDRKHLSPLYAPGPGRFRRLDPIPFGLCLLRQIAGQGAVHEKQACGRILWMADPIEDRELWGGITSAEIPQAFGDMAMNLIAQLEAEQIAGLGKTIPDFKAGDTIRVGYKVTEGTRSRVQNYEGVCIGRKGGEGIAGSFTVRKISFGEGVERVFPLYSTNIDSIDGRAPWPRAPRQAVLPARPSRQIGPDRRSHQLQRKIAE
jgi:tRNA (guanine37-N1)-methyltransferase